MASGDLLVTISPLQNEPVGSSSLATPDWRNRHPVLDFDSTTDEEAVFTFLLPPWYDGGGIEVVIEVLGSTATSGNVVFQAAIERIAHMLDIDSDDFAAFQSSGAVAVSGTSGVAVPVTVAFTDGAQMDSLAAGEWGRLKIRRDADDTSATDSMAGDAEVFALAIYEA